MASITVRTRPNGATFWEVAHRHPETGQRTGRRFDSLEEAEAFRESLGQPSRDGGRGSRSLEDILTLLHARSTADLATGCRLWAGALTNAGYGRLTWKVNGRLERGAHRVAYVAHVGPIPEGKVIDHLCRVRHCVNPDHLEVVTQRENIMRSPIAIGAANAAKTHCPQGHEYTPENTYVQVGRGYTGRLCRTCQLSRNKRRAS